MFIVTDKLNQMKKLPFIVSRTTITNGVLRSGRFNKPSFTWNSNMGNHIQGPIRVPIRSFSIINSKEDRDEFFYFLQKKFILTRGSLVKQRLFVLDLPIGVKISHAYTFSDLCGHGAFLFLAISYLENDFMNLRM